MNKMKAWHIAKHMPAMRIDKVRRADFRSLDVLRGYDSRFLPRRRIRSSCIRARRIHAGIRRRARSVSARAPGRGTDLREIQFLPCRPRLNKFDHFCPLPVDRLPTGAFLDEYIRVQVRS